MFSFIHKYSTIEIYKKINKKKILYNQPRIYIYIILYINIIQTKKRIAATISAEIIEFN